MDMTKKFHTIGQAVKEEFGYEHWCDMRILFIREFELNILLTSMLLSMYPVKFLL